MDLENGPSRFPVERLVAGGSRVWRKARPHPGPLPRGEGEATRRPWHIRRLLLPSPPFPCSPRQPHDPSARSSRPRAVDDSPSPRVRGPGRGRASFDQFQSSPCLFHWNSWERGTANEEPGLSAGNGLGEIVSRRTLQLFPASFAPFSSASQVRFSGSIVRVAKQTGGPKAARM